MKPSMKNFGIFILALNILLCLSSLNCYSSPYSAIKPNIDHLSLATDEIIFYSNGSTFAPVIVLQADAEVIWTWDDNTTSTSLTPTKDYGVAQLKANRLKVTPWSAIRRINIGYDAQDGGNPDIEKVANQKVSIVENLNLVAPYLKEWCSSYNNLIALDFSNFINIETIECFNCLLLKNVQLTNTPKLKRVCFEDNSLINFNLIDCNSIEDIRGALNNYSSIIFPTNTENIWHICVWSNPIINQHLFNNLSQFPKIADLYIPYTNQQGELIIPKSNPKLAVDIWAWTNKYSSLDSRGAFQNIDAYGNLDVHDNELTSVNISGCIQIKRLDLSQNKLNSDVINQILKQVDDYGTRNGTIDLRFNQPPTYIGLIYKANLESRGWIVNTDQIILVESITLYSTAGTNITTDNGTLELSAAVLPSDATNKSVSWSVVNVTGQAAISASGLLTAQKDGTVKALATANDCSGIKGELTITISNQLISIESITLSSPSGTNITTNNGTLQLFTAVLPSDATNKTVSWSVVNLTGQASISSSGLLTAQKDGTVKAVGTATDGTGVKGELQITISNQISSEKTQLFDLNFGWNIISAWITPTNPDIQTIFQELINAGKLVKIIDESGKTLEDFGTFGGWKNDIGNLSNEKGYKVNVSESVILNLQGTAVPLPIDINLHEGWNIICFPSENEQDAMNLFQPLIDSGKLIKVMNEAGYSIENFALWGGWKNNIGNLKPNKGYKVNMSSTGSITIPPNGFKLVILPPDPTESVHFRKVFIGNGTDHMNINLVDLIKSGFEIGDEIGIFDGDFCVGSATIDSKQIVQDFISIPASRNDDLSISRNGYITDNPITIKLFRNAQEYLLTPKLENNSTNTFIRGESMFATANAALATNITQLGKSDFIKCYPTPFTDQISIKIATSDLPKLDVKIYDANGRLIRNLYQGNAQIKTILIWDGKNDQGVRMKTGNYFLKVNHKVEKLLLAH